MKKVLIIHHLEPCWQSAYNKIANTSFESLCQDFIEHIEDNQYDWIILTQFEDWKAQNDHYLTGIAHYIDQWEEYGYGWGKEVLEDERHVNPKYRQEWCNGGNHSEMVLIADWMKEIKNEDIYISGAFDGECIEDLEIALDFLKINYKRVESLII